MATPFRAGKIPTKPSGRWQRQRLHRSPAIASAIIGWIANRDDVPTVAAVGTKPQTAMAATTGHRQSTAPL